MKVRKKNTNGAADFKNDKGLWVKTYSPNEYELCQTRSYTLWCGVTSRCLVGGSAQVDSPGYIGCLNLFDDFQVFAEWCQEQHGLMTKDTEGNFWQLDKDLLSGTDKRYSQDTCLFVPKYINALIVDSAGNRGKYPIGSSLYRNGKFRSYIGKPEKHLGYFDTAHNAHRAWQLAKIEALKDAMSDSSIQDHYKLLEALSKKIEIIQEDFDNFLVTGSDQ